MNPSDILALLEQQGLIPNREARCSALGGGVSSDIWHIEEGAQQLVVKRALPKLRVSQDWFADVSRNRHEQEYMDYVADFLPDAVPRILHRAPEHGFFVMEYLGSEFKNWKSLLLAGTPVIEHARQAATILGRIHRRSWNDPSARQRFATTPQFYQLRIEPYLLSTGKKHPELQDFFQKEAERLAAASLCLVHGDFSPKNILIGHGRMVILDCEVAWFGDPAFDFAFLINHFFLKAILFHEAASSYLALAQTAWTTYLKHNPMEQPAELERRVCRLLLMLLLARVDGKSPVEYLTDVEKRNCVRAFVTQSLSKMVCELPKLIQVWTGEIKAMPACQKRT